MDAPLLVIVTRITYTAVTGIGRSRAIMKLYIVPTRLQRHAGAVVPITPCRLIFIIFFSVYIYFYFFTLFTRTKLQNETKKKNVKFVRDAFLVVIARSHSAAGKTSIAGGRADARARDHVRQHANPSYCVLRFAVTATCGCIPPKMK